MFTNFPKEWEFLSSKLESYSSKREISELKEIKVLHYRFYAIL